MYPDFRILVVDDFALTRSMMRNCLTELGFTNLEEASDGVEAMTKIDLAYAESAPYSAIFLDWNMPRMTGIEVLETLKATETHSGIPVIMISAERERASVMRALQMGAHDFITKPFSPEILQAKLQKLLLNSES